MPHLHNHVAAHTGRRLTRKELSRNDTYVALSPKQKAIVDLTGVLCLAFWLEHEFDPRTLHCVPRPRTLTLPDGRIIEIDFWTCAQDGQESYWVVVARDDIESSPNGVAPRDVQTWDRAAHNAGITLQFIFEHQLERRAQRVANYLRLLPHVQAARRNARAGLIADRVLELYGTGINSLTFRQIEGSLSEFDAVETRMATCTLIHTGALHFDVDQPLTNLTALCIGGAA